MKKLSVIIYLIVAAMVFTSCAYVIAGDYLSDRSENDGAASSIPEGVAVIESYEDFKFHLYYDHTTYEGNYNYMVDHLFRLKFDLEYLQEIGKLEPLYAEYLPLVSEFLEGKQMTCYLPKWCTDPSDLMPEGVMDKELYLSVRDNPYDPPAESIDWGWYDYFPRAWKLDPEAVEGDELLMELFKTECIRREKKFYSDSGYLREKYPGLYAQIYPSSPIIGEIKYDAETMRTLVPVDTKGCGKYFYRLGETAISAFAHHKTYYEMNAGEPISLSPDYQGYITVVCVNDDGLAGENVLVYVESNVGKLSDTPVEFESAALRDAVCAYLGLETGDQVTPKMLAGIKEIFINGSDVYFNYEGLDVQQMNENDGSLLEGLSLADFRYFASLKFLEIYNNPIDKVEGEWLLLLTRLSLKNCGVSDISGLEGAFIEQLLLHYNNITDATVLSTFRCLDDVNLAHGPLEKIALPERDISQLMIHNTSIDSLDFLVGTDSLFSISCDNTGITDVSVLNGFTDLYHAYLPAGVDVSVIKDLPNLLNLFVGEEEIKSYYPEY
ncbi:MAG: hypothetical protein E7627_07715 [Ruminococcaceae bacterium]|nr:hypothetical protein [Oscillospiraceae bacterium]